MWPTIVQLLTHRVVHVQAVLLQDLVHRAPSPSAKRAICVGDLLKLDTSFCRLVVSKDQCWIFGSYREVMGASDEKGDGIFLFGKL